MATVRNVSPSKTLVVLIGASEWPDAVDFTSSVAFTNSASEFKNYLLNSFQIKSENLLNLFDQDEEQSKILSDIDRFLKDRIRSLQQAGESASDMILFFTGHGGFEGPSSEYYLAVRKTTQTNLIASAINIKALALTLQRAAPNLRRLIILDSCFASSATRAFQSFGDVATIKAKNAFSEPGAAFEETIPQTGTTLLCSSSANDPSIIADDHSYTLFSEGLLNVLQKGDPKGRKNLTVSDVHRLIWQYLSVNHPQKAPRPEVHSPNQAAGDIAQIPYFPNKAAEVEAQVQKFVPLEDTLQCCVILSEKEENLKRLISDVKTMLLSYKSQLIETSGKKVLQEDPYIIKVSEAFLSIDHYKDTLTALCRSSIAILDVTNYEPAMMFFLGLRSVVRRGVTVASNGGSNIIGETFDLPFNIKEVNIISHFRQQGKVKKPFDIMGERLVEGFRQKATLPNYLDLPTFDAIRNVPVSIIQKRWDWTEQVLLLCSFSKHYQENNWAEDLSILPIYIRDAVKEGEGLELDNEKPEIVRTLEIKTPRLVSQSLYETIRLTDMCVVDWTEWRPNVFFELGVRVSSNPIEPVCVIEKKHKQFIFSNEIQQENKSSKIAPPGMEDKASALLSGAISQCKRLLEWFQPIEYQAKNDYSEYDSEAFKNMVAYFDRQRQSRIDLSRPVSPLEKDSTYNLISEVIDPAEEAFSRRVYQDLINSANQMSNPEKDSLGISPVLYPKNKFIGQMADEGAVERRIAAWLYIKGRFTTDQIIQNKELFSDYINLGFLIIRGLVNSEHATDEELVQLIIVENRQLKRVKIRNDISKDILVEAKHLKEEARTYNALAQKTSGKEQRASLFKEALNALESAREVLKGELDILKEVKEKNQVTEVRTREIVAELANCFGIAGGTYRKWGFLADAIKMYDQGFQYEQDSTYHIQSSYNMVNSIVLHVTEDTENLYSQKDRIEIAVDVVRKQINTSREKDWWAWADLGLLYVLSEEDDLAIEAYRKIKDLGAKKEHITNISDVIMGLKLQIEMSYPAIADLVQRCILVLEKKVDEQ